MESPRNPLGLKMLNHISLVCSSVEKTREFYHGVLGFVPIQRPGSLKFEGAWLSNFGIGISVPLLQSENPKITKINPKDNHISFQHGSGGGEAEGDEDRIEEGGLVVDHQLFFHDPDGIMFEI
ncbi:hypothetical protein UlMin_003183 [Ulmus minor]